MFLEDGLPGPWPTGQVSFKSYLPSKKIYVSQTTGQDFFQALWRPQKKYMYGRTFSQGIKETTF